MTNNAFQVEMRWTKQTRNATEERHQENGETKEKCSLSKKEWRATGAKALQPSSNNVWHNSWSDAEKWHSLKFNLSFDDILTCIVMQPSASQRLCVLRLRWHLFVVNFRATHKSVRRRSNMALMSHKLLIKFNAMFEFKLKNWVFFYGGQRAVQMANHVPRKLINQCLWCSSI